MPYALQAVGRALPARCPGRANAAIRRIHIRVGFARPAHGCELIDPDLLQPNQPLDWRVRIGLLASTADASVAGPPAATPVMIIGMVLIVTVVMIVTVVIVDLLDVGLDDRLGEGRR